MVYPKGIPMQERITQSVQLLDIMPTILDFAHIDKKDLLLQGDSLIPLIKNKNVGRWNRRICYSDGMMNVHRPCSYEPYYQASLFCDKFHFLKNLINKKGVPKFFNVFDFISDPQEEHDLSGDDSKNLKIESELAGFIDAFQRTNAKMLEVITDKQEEGSVYSQNEIQRLIGLGYLQ
jgi:arylsulfatase A-like enzyme